MSYEDVHWAHLAYQRGKKKTGLAEGSQRFAISLKRFVTDFRTEHRALMCLNECLKLLSLDLPRIKQDDALVYWHLPEWENVCQEKNDNTIFLLLVFFPKPALVLLCSHLLSGFLLSYTARVASAAVFGVMCIFTMYMQKLSGSTPSSSHALDLREMPWGTDLVPHLQACRWREGIRGQHSAWKGEWTPPSREELSRYSSKIFQPTSSSTSQA